MDNNLQNYDFNRNQVALEQNAATLMRNVYWWMTLALAITGMTAYLIATNETIISLLYTKPLWWIVLAIVEFALVIVLSACINRLSAFMATVVFVLYSLLNGATMSVIFLQYTQSSIAYVFFICAGIFAVMAIIGSFTKKDLSTIGRVLIMAMVGMLIALVINLFVKSAQFDWIIAILGILIFTGLTAYDAQKIKNMLAEYSGDIDEAGQKLAILGSLTLYLDFINLFISLLRIFGNRR